MPPVRWQCNRVHAEFKTLAAADARAFERNVREASRQTGAFPGALVLDVLSGGDHNDGNL